VIDYAKRSKRNASLIHLIAEKGDSAKLNFHFTEFSEVRKEKV
jgi:hypothetical protein